MAEAALSSLCSICYTNPPKYRCPRCPGPVRTCSLPCYKRHQQRASCNGQRDPTAYLKKSQLATPAGIDHDYNFLTKIEHAIDRPVTKNTSSTSVSGAAKRRWNNDGPLQRYFRENRVIVDRAPVGMSRQKDNQTRYLPKSKRIMWTVEWIDEEGRKSLSEAHESASIEEAHQAVLAEKEKAGKKRKREDGDEDVSPASHPKTQPEANSDEVVPSEREDKDTSTPSTNNDHNTNAGIPTPAPDKIFFYLQKPHTPSTSRVLIPLSSSDTLTAALRDRVVLEYPTIYVLSHKPDALPAGFMTESAYLARAKKDDREMAEMLDVAPGSKRAVLEGGLFGSGPGNHGHGGGDEEDGEEDGANLDPAAILDMLRRDVRA